MSDCLFCKIEQGEIPSEKVYEDDDVIVIKDIYPKAKVHWLLIPRKHIASLNALQAEDEALMGKMVMLLPKLAKQAGLNDGFRTVINTEKGGGQEIYHIHFHLLGGSAMPFA